MFIRLFFVTLISLVGVAQAHQQGPSHVKPVEISTEEFTYFEMEVVFRNVNPNISWFTTLVQDKEFNNIPFATLDPVFKAESGDGPVSIKVYVDERFRDRVEYVCTRSEVIKGQDKFLRTKICSKIMRD